MFEDKFRYVFVRKEYDSLRLVKAITKKTAQKTIKILNRNFIINLKEPSYIYKLTKCYFIDYESGNQITLKDLNNLLSPEELDLIIGNHLVEEITRGLTQNLKDRVMLFLMGALFGALIAALIVMGVMQNKIDELYASFGYTITV